MEIIASGAEIRTRKTHVGKTGAVGASADRSYDRFDADLFHRRFGNVDQIDIRLDDLFHVAVAFLEFQIHSAFSVSVI